MSKSIWLEFEIGFWQGVTTFPKKTFDDATDAALTILSSQIKRADHTILFDNSTEEGYRLTAILSTTGTQWFEPKPPWARFAT